MTVQVGADQTDMVVVMADDDVTTILVGDAGPPGPPGPQGPPGQDGVSGEGSADAISLTPGGNVQATNVQNAILELDAEKVARAGDTMIGHLALPVGPAAANAVRKDYVDAADSALSANKADITYVDNQDALKIAKAGDTMTGHLALPTGPAAANATRKDYVDAADALKGDKTYVDSQDALRVLKAGDVMTGQLTLPTGPAAANAVRKDYVDAADALNAPLNSPIFTGDPRAPTPTAGDNDTSIATTAFVKSAMPPAGQTPGTATNDNAAAGKVGEYIEALSPSPVPLSDSVPANLISLTIPAGDWDVCAVVNFAPASTTSVRVANASISATSGSIDWNTGRLGQLSYASSGAVLGGNGVNIPIGPIRVSLAASATYYAVGQIGFSVSTMTGLANLRARRMR